MIELADLFGLRYFMLEEESTTSHLMLVKDENGKSATFKLESGERIQDDTTLNRQLEAKMIKEARKTIQEFRQEFLDYWNSLRSPLN